MDIYSFSNLLTIPIYIEGISYFTEIKLILFVYSPKHVFILCTMYDSTVLNTFRVFLFFFHNKRFCFTFSLNSIFSFQSNIHSSYSTVWAVPVKRIL